MGSSKSTQQIQSTQVQTLPFISPIFKFQSVSQTLPIFSYDKQSNTWQICKPCTDSLKLTTIRIATWNVWFSSYCYDERFNEIMRILKESKADIICLQEG